MRLPKGRRAKTRLGPSGDFSPVFAQASASRRSRIRFKVVGGKCGICFSRRLEFPVNAQMHHDATMLESATFRRGRIGWLFDRVEAERAITNASSRA